MCPPESDPIGCAGQTVQNVSFDSDPIGCAGHTARNVPPQSDPIVCAGQTARNVSPEGDCTGRMGAAQGRCALHREYGCCTGRMGVAQRGWALHSEDGCCTARMGAAKVDDVTIPTHTLHSTAKPLLAFSLRPLRNNTSVYRNTSTMRMQTATSKCVSIDNLCEHLQPQLDSIDQNMTSHAGNAEHIVDLLGKILHHLQSRNGAGKGKNR